METLLEKRGQRGRQLRESVEVRPALEQPTPLPGHALLVLGGRRGRRLRRDDGVDGVEARRDRGGGFPLAAAVAERKWHFVEFALGQLLAVPIERPTGAGQLSGERVGEHGFFLVFGHVGHGRPDGAALDLTELGLAGERPRVHQPQAADAGVELAGARQFGCPAAQRTHEPAVGIDAQKAAGRQHGHHDAHERTAEQQLVSDGASLDHVRSPRWQTAMAGERSKSRPPPEGRIPARLTPTRTASAETTRHT